MLNQANKLLIPALLAVIIGLGVAYCDNKRDKGYYIDANTGLHSQVDTWRDEYGKQHARKQSIEANLKATRIVFKAETDSLISQIDGLKKNLKNLKTFTIVNQEITDTITIALLDTVYVPDIGTIKYFKYEDPFLYIDGRLSKLADAVTLTYRITNPIKIVTYRRRYGFLGLKKENVVEVLSENPNASLTGLTHVVIAEKRKRLGFDVFAGYGVGPGGAGVYIGVGLGYRLISL